MFKWLVFGLVVALVSYWSPKEVQADPIPGNELEELQQELETLTELKELNELVKLSKSGSESSELDCEECQFAVDPNACEAECEEEILKMMLEKVRTPEEKKQARIIDSNSGKMKPKGWPRVRGSITVTFLHRRQKPMPEMKK